ncbi:GGDEF domain-containing protein [Couchioplanes caeruleus]|uniref:Diguanylate cyclase n=2 Tax=Couchioplanes caeruleus TaxID=56438 RepID=A0A1K0FQI5_9ACTN|nr:GGDEF domain-containing protein [Couchioplanes caeruleus]OJF15049.1 diguanylate cyclase [Couchioplanes caeruleus subsp. caeruleus]ROP32319.1 diguanylate cyclase (GGDEF)-like protein [Couchioplanes caeruleus]
MTWLDQLPDCVDDLRRAGELQQGGRSAEALPILDKVLEVTSDPLTRAYALVQRFGALINLGRVAEFATAMTSASNAVHESSDPYLRGQMHAFAALGAHLQSALDRGVTHLVQASRALAAVTDGDAETAWGWHDLAMAYSYLGFHGHALTAIEQARQVGAAGGMAPELFAAPGIRLRNAVALDHQGDTDGCLRVLRDIDAELTRYVATGADARLRPSSRPVYGYALARRAALGESTDTDVAGLFTGGGDSVRSRDLRHLGGVCLDIAAGRPAEALLKLDAVPVSQEILGPAEPARLRSICHAAAGDHEAAHKADRYAFRLAAQRIDRLRDGYLDGVSARLDAQETHRDVGRYGDETLTDPLTGLPNRRQLERYVAAMLARGEHAAIGVCDLIGFSAVNARHGRHCGDLVLQRIAGILNRVMRRGDFVARFAGDEFVVVLPGAGAAQAAEVSRRISAAAAGENWQVLVPGTPITLAAGWSEVGTHSRGLSAALAEAAGRRSPA